MSRGPGNQQRAILDAIGREPGKLIRLGGGTRSGRSALSRAAAKLQAAGKCVIVRLWNDDDTAVRIYVAHPDAVIDGKPVALLSVERVTGVTGSTLKGSTRDLARRFGTSHVQMWRDIRASKGIPRTR